MGTLITSKKNLLTFVVQHKLITEVDFPSGYSQVIPILEGRGLQNIHQWAEILRAILESCIPHTCLYALAVKEYWFITYYLYHLILGLSLWLSLVISQSQLLEFILSFQYIWRKEQSLWLCHLSSLKLKADFETLVLLYNNCIRKL